MPALILHPGLLEFQVKIIKKTILKVTNYLKIGLDYDFGAKIYSINLELSDGADRFNNVRKMYGTILVSVDDVADQEKVATDIF